MIFLTAKGWKKYLTANCFKDAQRSRIPVSETRKQNLVQVMVTKLDVSQG